MPLAPVRRGAVNSSSVGILATKGLACGGAVVPGLPDVVRRQLHSQVGAEGVGVVQGLQAQGVELFLAPGKAFPDAPASGERLSVPGDTHSLEYGVPQALHGLLLG